MFTYSDVLYLHVAHDRRKVNCFSSVLSPDGYATWEWTLIWGLRSTFICLERWNIPLFYHNLTMTLKLLAWDAIILFSLLNTIIRKLVQIYAREASELPQNSTLPSPPTTQHVELSKAPMLQSLKYALPTAKWSSVWSNLRNPVIH